MTASLRLVPPAEPAPGPVSLSLAQRAAYEALRAHVGAMGRTFAGSATTPAKAGSVAADALGAALLAEHLERLSR